MNALGAMIAIYTDTYHLSLKDQREVLGKKPDLITIGNQKFLGATMTFAKNNLLVKFLVTIHKNVTYMITLVSSSPSPDQRLKNIDTLIKAIQTLKYNTPSL